MINSNILIFSLSYLFITFSIIGYGLLIEKISNKMNSGRQLGYTGLLGIFFLIIYSYLSNLLIPHSKIHNIVFIIIGFFSFFYFFQKYSQNFFFKKDLILLFVVFILKFI